MVSIGGYRSVLTRSWALGISIFVGPLILVLNKLIAYRSSIVPRRAACSYSIIRAIDKPLMIRSSINIAHSNSSINYSTPRRRPDAFSVRAAGAESYHSPPLLYLPPLSSRYCKAAPPMEDLGERYELRRWGLGQSPSRKRLFTLFQRERQALRSFQSLRKRDKLRKPSV